MASSIDALLVVKPKGVVVVVATPVAPVAPVAPVGPVARVLVMLVFTLEFWWAVSVEVGAGADVAGAGMALVMALVVVAVVGSDCVAGPPVTPVLAMADAMGAAQCELASGSALDTTT